MRHNPHYISLKRKHDALTVQWQNAMAQIAKLNAELAVYRERNADLQMIANGLRDGNEALTRERDYFRRTLQVKQRDNDRQARVIDGLQLQSEDRLFLLRYGDRDGKMRDLEYAGTSAGRRMLPLAQTDFADVEKRVLSAAAESFTKHMDDQKASNVAHAQKAKDKA